MQPSRTEIRLQMNLCETALMSNACRRADPSLQTTREQTVLHLPRGERIQPPPDVPAVTLNDS